MTGSTNGARSYSKLEAAGLSRKVFDKSRAYLANSSGYVNKEFD